MMRPPFSPATVFKRTLTKQPQASSKSKFWFGVNVVLATSVAFWGFNFVYASFNPDYKSYVYSHYPWIKRISSPFGQKASESSNEE